MKDVAGCDKPRVGAEQPLIRGCPNGETRPRRKCGVTASLQGEEGDNLANWNILVARGKENNDRYFIAKTPKHKAQKLDKTQSLKAQTIVWVLGFEMFVWNICVLCFGKFSLLKIVILFP